MTNAQDAERDERISMEIVVDCYDEEEQMMGWYYYLDDTMLFPFTAVCTIKRRSSPLKEDEIVEVIGMASADECEHEMFVEIAGVEGDTRIIPLSQLTAPAADVKTQEAIADWLYWVS
jgi:Calcium binding